MGWLSVTRSLCSSREGDRSGSAAAEKQPCQLTGVVPPSDKTKDGPSAKDLLTKYGSAYLVTSISLSLVSFAICYVRHPLSRSLSVIHTHTFSFFLSLSLCNPTCRLGERVVKQVICASRFRDETTLEATQGPILSQSPTDAIRFWWHLYGS